VLIFCAQELKEILAAQIPGKQAELKELKTKYGGVSLGEVKVHPIEISRKVGTGVHRGAR
jgi:hypothetical protein